MRLYILLSLAFVISVISGTIMIPLILNFCKKKNLYDLPDARKRHKTTIPRLGGISFLPSMLLSLVLVLLTMSFTRKDDAVVHLSAIYFIIGLTIVYVIGILDDVFILSAKVKFIAQILAASFLPIANLYINNLYGLCGIYDIPAIIGMPLTVFLVVFIINSINLIDGIDGLSTSLTLIALFGFLILFKALDLWMFCILIVGLMGVLVAFLGFNMFGNAEKGHKLFMGDSGSLTLGFILAYLFLKYSMNNPDVVPYRNNAILASSSLLIVPVFDVVRVIIVRYRSGSPIFKADRNHIHHRLIQLGLSQHQTLGVILLLAISFILINYGLSHVMHYSFILFIDIVIYALFHWVLHRKILSAEKQN